MTAFYSEHDPYAAQYLRNLIAAGLIAPGVVDERDLQDIEPYELLHFTQVHLCAGIGIWSGALRAAGWPDHEPIWTGSFPCQPFSQAGRRKGIQDERHLWPVGLNLIAQCRPARFAGEQVASKDGREWLDTVSADLEALGFAFGASDLCAAGFQQAHIRQRNYFAGLADFMQPGRPERWAWSRHGSPASSSTSGLADDDDARLQGRPGDKRSRRADEFSVGTGRMAGGMAESDSGERLRIANSEKRQCDGETRGRQQSHGCVANDCKFSGVEHANLSGEHGRAPSRKQSVRDDDDATLQGNAILHPGKIASRWYDVDWLLCRNPAGEPSWRPVESRTQQMVNGISIGMGYLRSYKKAKEIIYAAAYCPYAHKILRTLLEADAPETVWSALGGQIGFSKASILLACLLEYTGELGNFVHCAETRGSQASKEFLRNLRENWLAPRSSFGREHSQQFTFELANALSELPQDGTLQVLESNNGFVLAHNIKNRMGKLRAYGNALDWQTAKAFCEVLVEICGVGF